MSYRRQLRRDLAALELDRTERTVQAPRRVYADEPIAIAAGEVVEIAQRVEGPDGDVVDVVLARARGSARAGAAGVHVLPADQLRGEIPRPPAEA